MQAAHFFSHLAGKQGGWECGVEGIPYRLRVGKSAWQVNHRTGLSNLVQDKVPKYSSRGFHSLGTAGLFQSARLTSPSVSLQLDLDKELWDGMN